MTDAALAGFRACYRDDAITKDAIFDYVYGVLHAPGYRERFADDLAKALPRIPFAPDFHPFADAGRALMALHLDYEDGEEYPLDVVFAQEGEPRPEHFRIGRRAMRFADDERSVLIVNERVRLAGIPPEAHCYEVNGRDAARMVHRPLPDRAGPAKRHRSTIPTLGSTTPATSSPRSAGSCTSAWKPSASSRTCRPSQRMRTDVRRFVPNKERRMVYMTKEILEQILRERGWYKTRKSISNGNGVLYRLVDDTPVSFYPGTCKIIVQGRETPLKKTVKKFFEGGLVERDVSAFRTFLRCNITPSGAIFISSIYANSAFSMIPAISIMGMDKKFYFSSIYREPVSQSDGNQSKSTPSRRVFIISYGQDVTARERLELFLRHLKLNPIALPYLTGNGGTFIRNLDKLTDTDFACVLLTPDGEEKLRDSDQPLRPDERKHVVPELGLLLSRLGGKRVAILVKDAKNKPIERLADIEGLIYIPFEEHIDETRIKLARRLREAGFDIKAADLKTDL